MLNDLRYAFRQLLKNPGFSAVAVLTLALGIGANTAIFSAVNAVLLRPLPYPESDQLVWLSERSLNFPVMSISFPNFTDWRTQQKVFEHVGVYNWSSYNLTGSGDPLRLRVSRISADAFAALRVKPALGRLFTEDEDKPGGPPLVVLSHGLWADRFGSDAGLVNQSITLDGRPCTVIGVMPAGFAFPSPVDVWVPVGPMASEAGYQNRGRHPGLLAVARLKPGVTVDQARTELNTIAARLEKEYPASNSKVGVRIDPLIENRVGATARAALWALLGAVGMVLLIACGNVANLLLARAATRQREMAVRAALGASRWRIARQLLTESLLLAFMGGTFGLLLGNWGLHALLAISGDSMPRSVEISPNSGVLAFTAAVAMLTGILFGLAPAWQASRAEVHGALKETSRGATGGRARFRHGLVVAEVALTLVLLVGAGLLLRSFHRLQTLNPGFSHERVLSFRLDLPQKKYSSDERQIAFFQDLTERLRALPGVQSVGFGSQIPFVQNGSQTSYTIEGQPDPRPGEAPSMEVTAASPDYFRALGIPLLRGRYFTEQDNRDHLRHRDLTGLNEGQRWSAGLNVVIVDEEFVRRHWPNEDPIGKRIRADGATLSIVGVVRRIKIRELNEQGGFVQAYFSALQVPSRGRIMAVKTSLAPEPLMTAVRQQTMALHPDQPVYDLRTLTDLRNQSLTPQRLNLTLLGIFAGVALALAVVGLYGVLAFAVTQRTREIGIRMALGAQSRDVLRLVIRHGLRLTVFGAALGMAGAWALTRWMEALLYEIKPTDPMTFLATIGMLLAVALVACWLPARRAARLDPMEALKNE